MTEPTDETPRHDAVPTPRPAGEVPAAPLAFETMEGFEPMGLARTLGFQISNLARDTGLFDVGPIIVQPCPRWCTTAPSSNKRCSRCPNR